MRDPAQRSNITLPDRRTLDVWQAGPPDVPTACPHLYAEHGHLTLVVDTFGQILDELVAGGG